MALIGGGTNLSGFMTHQATKNRRGESQWLVCRLDEQVKQTESGLKERVRVGKVPDPGDARKGA